MTKWKTFCTADDLRVDYGSGLSLKAIGQKHDVSTGVVQRACRKHGIPIRPRGAKNPMTEDERTTIRRFWSTAASLDEIATALSGKRSKSAISNWACSEGLPGVRGQMLWASATAKDQLLASLRVEHGDRVLAVEHRRIPRGGRQMHVCTRCVDCLKARWGPLDQAGYERCNACAGRRRRIYDSAVDAALSRHRHNYVRDAKYDLTADEELFMFCEPCVYCEREPKAAGTRTIAQGQTIRFMGLDRIDNTGGHTHDNVVPCCGACNKSRGAQTLEEWLDWLVVIGWRMRAIIPPLVRRRAKAA